jgi:fucose 4-O-acetylase-like acetyltransferase
MRVCCLTRRPRSVLRHHGSKEDSRARHRIASEGISASRDRYVDLARVAAVLCVIVGHWFVIAITVSNERLEGHNILALLPWTHGLTWFFQVVPLFFLVGGYANAASWSAFEAAGGAWAGWIRMRVRRLLRPTTVYFVVALVAVVVARAAGVDPNVVDDAAWLIAIHLWFLAIYLGVVAAAPVMLAAHRRWGARVVVLVAGLAALVDVARIGFDVSYVGALNYALVWAAIHQAGFLWRDGRLPHGAAVAAAGMFALLLLTGLGPYPLSMVNVPGAELQPTQPPGLSILALAALQAGIVLALRRPGKRWLHRPSVSAAVTRLNHVVMTLFLWHLVPVVIGAVALYGTGLFPQPEIGSGPWLGLRVVWIAVLAGVLAILVAVFGRFERGSDADRPWNAAGAVVVAAVGAAVLGLSIITVHGFTEPGTRLPVLGAASYAVAVVLLGGAARSRVLTNAGPTPAPSRRQGSP